MAKNSAKEAEQKAILSEDTQSPAVSEVKTPPKKVKKSRRRVSLEEFSVVNNLRPEVKAGFKAWLKISKNGIFHFDEEWEKLYKEYQNRTL